MRCCPNCFGDDYLSERINTLKAGRGVCHYCKTSNTVLVDTNRLIDELEFLTSIYIETSDESGQSIADCITADWGIFKSLDRLTCVQLIGDIIGDTMLGSKRFVPATLTHVTPKEMWFNFCDEMIKQYRFFPINQPDTRYLPLLFSHLREDIPRHAFVYRARIQNNSLQHRKSEMGMPPPEVTRAGRANPVGIPYFYAASDVETAIAEVRPHPGNKVSVCKFKVLDSLKLLNLINPRDAISPFKIAFLEDEDYLLQLRYDVEFLCHLGTELSKPIVPESAELEYLPTQYLCEFIKKSEFDGVKFTSSVGPGNNYTLFTQNKVKPAHVDTYYIEGLQYKIDRAKDS